MIDGADSLRKGAPRKITDHGHQALKQTEGKRGERRFAAPQAHKAHAVGNGYRKRVHRKAERQDQQRWNTHCNLPFFVRLMPERAALKGFFAVLL